MEAVIPSITTPLALAALVLLVFGAILGSIFRTQGAFKSATNRRVVVWIFSSVIILSVMANISYLVQSHMLTCRQSVAPQPVMMAASRFRSHIPGNVPRMQYFHPRRGSPPIRVRFQVLGRSLRQLSYKNSKLLLIIRCSLVLTLLSRRT
jgi:ABC-type transport system involved in multi-copper enzyme maturation permease subunit